MTKIWHITPTQTVELDIDASSLDAITRQLPDGYYSTFRTFDGCRRVLGLSAHLQRLYEPVPTPEVDESTLRLQLRALLEPYCPGETRVRIMMTKQGQLYVAIEPLKPLSPEVFEHGVRVETTELRRQDPRLKSTTFIARSDAERKHIAQQGIFEALLVKDGKILEGMTSNFFYIPHALTASRKPPPSARREKVLCTARDDILLGITRETVIEVARGRGVAVEYVPLKRDQLTVAEEAFITSSSRGMVPVVQIDEVTIGQGSPGSITKELIRSYNEYVLKEAEQI